MPDLFVSEYKSDARDVTAAALPVWVHSSFRVSSTWFWSRFRQNPHALAFHEIFNESLATLTPEKAAAISYRDGDLRHPPSAPYFLEYAPFLAGDWLKFDESMAYQCFIPTSPDRSITSAEAIHIERLIEKAGVLGRTPLLTAVRSLGRVYGLRRRFGGYHILLHRNLFRQWCSYSSQELRGNPYFVDRTDLVIEENRHDRFLAALSGMFPPVAEGTKCSSWGHFLRFALLHLYLYTLALPDCELDVCIDRLAVDRSYRCETEARIVAATGLRVDLTGCHENIEFSALPMGGRQREALETVRVVAGSIPDFLPGWSNRQQDFLNAQLCALETELDRFVFYTEALVRHVTASFLDLATNRETAQRNRDPVRERDQLVSEIKDLRQRVAKVGWLRNEQHELQEELSVSATRNMRLASACAKIRSLEDALAAVYTSTSWRISAPLRALKRLALRIALRARSIRARVRGCAYAHGNEPGVQMAGPQSAR
jgi:hypothetical protein